MRIWVICVLVLGLVGHAAAATMTTSITGTSLGSSHVGTPSTTTQRITISNDAAATSALTYTVTSNATEVTVTPASGTVAAGASQDVTITFTPSLRGTHNATITVSGNDGANPSDAFAVTGIGTSGNLTVTWSGAPAALDFGSLQIAGGTSQRTITIANPAPANEALTFALDITSGASDFARAVPAKTSLAVGESIAVTVTFDPTAAGTRAGVATVTSNDAFNPSDPVNLTGQGLGAVFTPSASSIDFGTVPVGSFVEQTLTITNTGNQSGTITSISSGNAAFTYNVTGGMPPRTVAAGASIDVVIRFTPVDGSIVNTTLAVATDATPASLSIGLVGDGLYRAITITAMDEPDLMIDLGDRRVGVQTAKLVTVTNTGETTVELALPTSSAAPCTIAPIAPTTLPASVAPAATATFEIRLTPTAVGIGACTITVTTDIPTTDTIEIAYRGVAPEVALSNPTTGTIDFGVIDVDAPAEIRTVVVTNTGTAPLAIGPCTVPGTTHFTVLTSCTGLTIAPGANATLTVSFDPDLELLEQATLAIGVDALSTSQVNVALAGIGADQRLDLSALVVSFPDTDVNPADPPIEYIDVTNPQNALTMAGETLHISAVTIDDPAYQLANAGPFTVEPNGKIRLAITFRPTTPGPHDAALLVISDVGGSAMAQVALHGRAIPPTEAGGCCDSGRAGQTPLALCVLLLVIRRRRTTSGTSPSTRRTACRR